jgi:hypothetical protein
VKKRAKYKKPQHRTKAMYIVLEHMDFDWEIDDVRIVIEMWDEGHSLAFITAFMDRDELEILALIFELHYRGVLRERSSGVFSSKPLEKTLSHTSRVTATLTGVEEEVFTVMTKENFIFTQDQVVKFDELWNSGASLEEIAKKIKRRKIKDVVHLMLDRSFNEKINAVPIAIDGRFLSDGDFMGTCIKSIS